MKTILTMKDIAKAASLTVSDYLARGYILNPSTGKTIYSDKYFYIDLVRESGAPGTVRIELVCTDGDEFAFETREFDGDNTTFGHFFPDNGRSRLISSIKLYCVERGTVYTTSEEEYEEIRHKRIVRAGQSDYTVYGKDRFGKGGWCETCLKPEQVLGRVHEVSGYKRVKIENIMYIGRKYKGTFGSKTCRYFVQFNRPISAGAWMLEI